MADKYFTFDNDKTSCSTKARKANSKKQGERLRIQAAHCALRSVRKSPEFFQAGKPVKSEKKVQNPIKKGFKGKRGRKLITPSSEQKQKRCSHLIVIEEGDNVPAENEPFLGQVVWALFDGYHGYHPALVIKGSMVNLATADSTKSFVFWFSDKKVSAVSREKMLNFVSHFNEKAEKCNSKRGQSGILKAIEEVRWQVQKSGHVVQDMNPFQWAQMGFPTLDSAGYEAFRPDPDFEFSEDVSERLLTIGAEIRQKAFGKDRDIPNEFLEENAITAVWLGKRNISDVCISCGDSDREVHCEHPLFEGGLCLKCKENLQATICAIGEDGSDSFCAVCGAGGHLFVCDTATCSKVFCILCVEELGGKDILKKVKDAKTWSCFLCQPYKLISHGLLKPRSERSKNLVLFFDSGHRITKIPDLAYFKVHRSIRVLSLFDGIGTGLLALKRAGLLVDVYYTSETDQQACIICQANHGSVIQPLGDITKITSEKLAEMTPIDLLIGGSPCNELSLANPLRKGFQFEGSGVLFFDFYRILQDIRMLNGTTHLFWMYENVASMPNVYRSVISRFLQCQPALWDAKHLSAQKRCRFFWGNIPGLYSTPEFSDILKQDVDLNSVLMSQCKRKANVEHVRTITTNSNSLLQGPGQKILPVTMADTEDTLWLSELERLFGFPAHYTDVANLSPTQRRALLGRSWSVQVVTEIFRPLTQYFATVISQGDGNSHQ